MKTPWTRHARLTSLVGVLLTAAVAGCLVAFSLVAQHAARQRSDGPSVRPLAPQEDGGAPLTFGDLDGSDSGDASPPDQDLTRDTRFDDLLAQAAREDEVEPRRAPRTPLRKPDHRPDEPDRCTEACSPRGTDRPRNEPPEPAGEGDDHDDCAPGHLKGKGKGHEHGRGKGHCEHQSEASEDEGGGATTKPHGRAKDDKGKTDPDRPEHSDDREDPSGDRKDHPGKKAGPPDDDNDDEPPGHAKNHDAKGDDDNDAKGKGKKGDNEKDVD